jgi:hypothetical protein
VTLTHVEQLAAERARDLIAKTEFFAELGLGRLAESARMVAGDVVDLVASLEAERSTRSALQARAARLQEIVGSSTYFMCIAEAAHEAAAIVTAKKELAARLAEVQRVS